MNCHRCRLEMTVYWKGHPAQLADEWEILCPACSALAKAAGGVLARAGRPRRETELTAVPAGMCQNCGLDGARVRASANFQCMRCLKRSVLCGPCSMDGTCPWCARTQPANVDAFVKGVDEGLNDPGGRMTDAEMAREARELSEFFGDDFQGRVFGGRQ
jgi:hypothetical protein